MTAREASLKAGMGHGAISRYLSGERASPPKCREMAAFFGVPEEFVLELAGWLTASAEEKVRAARLGRATEGLAEDDVELVEDFARTLQGRRKASR